MQLATVRLSVVTQRLNAESGYKVLITANAAVSVRTLDCYLSADTMVGKGKLMPGLSEADGAFCSRMRPQSTLDATSASFTDPDNHQSNRPASNK